MHMADPDDFLQACFEYLHITVPFISGTLFNTSILLGTNRFHQFFIFGCILAQIVSTSICILIYYKELHFIHIWWLIIEFIRLCISAIVRVDRLISSEATIFFINNIHNLYKTIALLNIFGFIWSFPIWIFYALSLSNDEASIVFFVISLIFISLHIISSIPSISKISQLTAIHTTSTSTYTDDQQFGDRFLASSIEPDIRSPNKSVSPPKLLFTTDINNNKKIVEDDDPILYTA
eukprot:UN00213